MSMETPPSDPAATTGSLVERARAGDQEAWNGLFGLAAEKALWFVRLRLGGRLRSDVESVDVLQEAYLDAWRALPSYEHRDPGGFNRWLCRIIENRIRGLADHFGAARRKPPGGCVPVSRILEEAASRTSPASAAARREHRERLGKAVAALEPDERDAVLLRFFQGRTIDEIGQVLGRSPTSVRRLLGRSTARVGRLLGDGA